MDIQMLCCLPDELLQNLKAHSGMSELFKHVDTQKFSVMMSKIITQMMSEDTYVSYNHSTIKITKEHSIAWMECFMKTLNDMNIDEKTSLILHKKMTHMIENMLNENTEILNHIKQYISTSSDSKRLIHDIRELLNQYEMM